MKKIIFGLVALLITIVSYCQPQNEKNPFDFAGKIHNEILDYFLSAKTKPANGESVLKLIDLYLKENKSVFSLNELYNQQNEILKKMQENNENSSFCDIIPKEIFGEIFCN